MPLRVLKFCCKIGENENCLIVEGGAVPGLQCPEQGRENNCPPNITFLSRDTGMMTRLIWEQRGWWWWVEEFSKPLPLIP